MSVNAWLEVWWECGQWGSGEGECLVGATGLCCVMIEACRTPLLGLTLHRPLDRLDALGGDLVKVGRGRKGRGVRREALGRGGHGPRCGSTPQLRRRG